MKKALLILLGAIAIGVSTFVLTSAHTTAKLNLCYSQVFSELSEVASSSHEQLEPMIESLPMRGYESDCQEILKAARQLRAKSTSP